MNILTNAIINQKNIEEIDSLISDDNINLQDSDGMTPLHYVCKSYNCTYSIIEIIELLLIRGANPNIQNKYGITILHMSIRRIDNVHIFIDILELLIKHGANINIQAKSGNTLLHYVILHEYPFPYSNKIEIIKNLLKYNADINLKNKKDKTPLQLVQDIIEMSNNKDDKHYKTLAQYNFRNNICKIQSMFFIHNIKNKK